MKIWTIEELTERTCMERGQLASLATHIRRLADGARRAAIRGAWSAAKYNLRKIADAVTGNPLLKE